MLLFANKEEKEARDEIKHGDDRISPRHKQTKPLNVYAIIMSAKK